MNVDIKVRDEMKSKFGKILPANSIEQIENSIHKFSIDYASVNETPYLLDQIYDTKGDEILKLIKDNESDYFITAIKNKKIDLSQIAFLKPDELNPEKYDKIIKKKALEEYKKNNQATSNVFECRKCKNKKCQVTQRQTRAADEPATTFVTCMECGYEFSFN
jgi:DNA-directed RNA polymerase subunit M/transcription elongation factor TFIIS